VPKVRRWCGSRCAARDPMLMPAKSFKKPSRAFVVQLQRCIIHREGSMYLRSIRNVETLWKTPVRRRSGSSKQRTRVRHRVPDPPYDAKTPRRCADAVPE
jgi:hypothetical protein